MSQRQWIVIIGVWVMIFLFLGFPSSWEKTLAILTGLLIIFLAYRIRFKGNPLTSGSSFTDNISSNIKQGGQVDRSNDQEKGNGLGTRELGTRGVENTNNSGVTTPKPYTLSPHP